MKLYISVSSISENCVTRKNPIELIWLSRSKSKKKKKVLISIILQTIRNSNEINSTLWICLYKLEILWRKFMFYFQWEAMATHQWPNEIVRSFCVANNLISTNPSICIMFADLAVQGRTVQHVLPRTQHSLLISTLSTISNAASTLLKKLHIGWYSTKDCRCQLLTYI